MSTSSGDDRNQAQASERIGDSTREMLAQAGLSPAETRRKGGLVLIVALVVLVLVGVGGYLALGVLSGSSGSLSLGEDSSPTTRQSGVESRSEPSVDLSPEEVMNIRRLQDGSVPSPRKGRSSESRSARRLRLFYQTDQKLEAMPDKPRRMQGVTPRSYVELQTGSIAAADALGQDKTEISPTSPTLARGTLPLTEIQIQGVVRKHSARVKRHLERLTAQHPSLSGKLYVVIRVRPDGRVDKVRVATPKFQGTAVEDYLVQTLGDWKFPAFEGSAFELTYPLILVQKQVE